MRENCEASICLLHFCQEFVEGIERGIGCIAWCCQHQNMDWSPENVLEIQCPEGSCYKDSRKQWGQKRNDRGQKISLLLLVPLHLICCRSGLLDVSQVPWHHQSPFDSSLLTEVSHLVKLCHCCILHQFDCLEDSLSHVAPWLGKTSSQFLWESSFHFVFFGLMCALWLSLCHTLGFYVWWSKSAYFWHFTMCHHQWSSTR